MRAAIVATALVCSFVLSGCMGDDASSAAAQAKKAAAAKNAQAMAIDTDLEKVLNTPLQRPAVGDMSTWYAISLNVSAEGALAGFEWTIPEGAPQNSRLSETLKYVYLEIAPIVFGKEPDRWGLYAFRPVDGKAAIAGATTRVTQVTTVSNPLPSPPVTQTPNLKPSFFAFNGLEMSAGEKVHFVLAAASPDPSPFGLVFRVRDEAPSFETKPAESTDALLSDLRGQTARTLKTLGVGSGYRFGGYTESNVLFPPIISMLTSVSGDIKVSSGLPAENRIAISVRDLTLSMQSDVSEGWTIGNGLYFGDDAAGLWSATVEAHGAQKTFRSALLQTSRGIAGPLTLVGFPTYSFVAEGAGKSRSEFHVEGANRNEVEFLSYAHLTIGASLKTLIGMDAATRASALLGLAGNVPPTAFTLDGGDLVMDSPLDGVQRWPIGPPGQSP